LAKSHLVRWGSIIAAKTTTLVQFWTFLAAFGLLVCLRAQAPRLPKIVMECA
jgi:hypothetical protein